MKNNTLKKATATFMTLAIIGGTVYGSPVFAHATTASTYENAIGTENETETETEKPVNVDNILDIVSEANSNSEFVPEVEDVVPTDFQYDKIAEAEEIKYMEKMNEEQRVEEVNSDEYEDDDCHEIEMRLIKGDEDNVDIVLVKNGFDDECFDDETDVEECDELDACGNEDATISESIEQEVETETVNEITSEIATEIVTETENTIEAENVTDSEFETENEVIEVVEDDIEIETESEEVEELNEVVESVESNVVDDSAVIDSETIESEIME